MQLVNQKMLDEPRSLCDAQLSKLTRIALSFCRAQPSRKLFSRTDTAVLLCGVTLLAAQTLGTMIVSKRSSVIFTSVCPDCGMYQEVYVRTVKQHEDQLSKIN